MTTEKPAEIVGRCPICKRPTDATYRPFCSRRCSDVDLQRWFAGSYAIPAIEVDDPDMEGGDLEIG